MYTPYWRIKEKKDVHIWKTCSTYNSPLYQCAASATSGDLWLLLFQLAGYEWCRRQLRARFMQVCVRDGDRSNKTGRLS